MPDLRWTRVAGEHSDDAGSVPLVLVHGFATTVTQCWLATGWLRRLGSQRTLVFLHLPWHDDASVASRIRAQCGQRRVTEGVLALEDSLDHSLTALDVLDSMSEAIRRSLDDEANGSRGPDRGVVDLFGYSLGARLSWDLACEEERLVRRLVLGGLPAHDELSGFAHGVRTGSLRDDPSVSPAAREVLEFVEASDLDERGLLTCADRLSVPEFRPSTGHAPTQPTLVVAGSKDNVAQDSPDLVEYLGPQAVYRELPGRTHVNALTSGAFARAVTAHLDAN
ncbi:MAG: hypothetical protein L0G59_08840 [Kocuria sp.]|nr:hypothetical protein [Kocuria sp.]MDN5617933.1 hypothetical protein [Kocuria sp.]